MSKPSPGQAPKKPWLKFFPSDWRSDPGLRACSSGARGLWIEMLCLMHEASSPGSLLLNGKQMTHRQLAALTGLPLREVEGLFAELDEAGVFGRDEDGTIFSRRMRRDVEKAARDKTNGAGGGNPEIRRGSVPKSERVRPYKRSDSPEKTRRIWDRDKGRCHWCEVPLAWDHTDGATNFFHVDHVIAVCDGGTNDEGNLVAACSVCNHKRARNHTPTPTSDTGWVGVGSASDSKAQRLEAKSHMPEAGKPASAQAREPASPPPMEDQEFEAACRHAVIRWDPPKGTFGVMLSLDFDRDEIVAVLRREVASRTKPVGTWKLWAEDVVPEQIQAAKARASLSGPAMPTVFVAEGTPEWEAWDRYGRANDRPRGYPNHAQDGSRRGWQFPSAWPPGTTLAADNTITRGAA